MFKKQELGYRLLQSERILPSHILGFALYFRTVIDPEQA